MIHLFTFTLQTTLHQQPLWPHARAAVRMHLAQDCHDAGALTPGGVDLVARHVHRLAHPDHFHNLIPEQIAKGVRLFCCATLTRVEVLCRLPSASSRLPFLSKVVGSHVRGLAVVERRGPLSLVVMS